jgi:hypothetical protein
VRGATDSAISFQRAKRWFIKAVVGLGSVASSRALAGDHRAGSPSKTMCQPAGESLFRMAHSSTFSGIARS